MSTLRDLLASDAYLSYAYSYPHKTTYRTLSPPVSLGDVWSDEDRRALFLYLHVPFCEQRCGFCNLYTQVQPKEGIAARYVAAVERQAEVVRREVLHTGAVARLAIGGGTPTFLGAPLLGRLLGVAQRLGARGAPASVEVSPGTLDDAQLTLLADFGVSRVSLGVQSTFSAETAAVSRLQAPPDVARCIRAVAEAIPVCNVDLIYGLPGQNADSLRRSIDAVITLGANELYLYPLYVRPLTGLARADLARAPEHTTTSDAPRLNLYRAGRDHLSALGWVQRSMRMFQAPDTPAPAGPTYRCQDDGMVGLGAGARSYTRRLHYASPYAVRQSAIRDGIEAWISQSDQDFGQIRHGMWLDEQESRRRYLLLLLLESGVPLDVWRDRFGTELLEDLPDLREVIAEGLAVLDDSALRLTPFGQERSDVLGYWLQSDAVRSAREAWDPR